MSVLKYLRCVNEYFAGLVVSYLCLAECSLGDMILSARDRKMITNECLLYDCFELRIYYCSPGDMILSARDRKMIANECSLL